MTVELAAGVLCWRRARDGLEVLLVHRPRYDDWSWPKGKAHDGEPLTQTAVREAAEETGLAVALGRPLGEVRYRLSDGRRKQVTYWVATARTRGPGLGPQAPDEVDGLAWLPVGEARALLTRQSDTAPLDRLEAHELAGALQTVPVVVLRHGTSGPGTRGRARTPTARWSPPAVARPAVSSNCWPPGPPSGSSARRGAAASRRSRRSRPRRASTSVARTR